MKNVNVLVLFAVVVFAVTGAASADIMTDNGLGLVDVVTIHSPGYLANNLSVYAGQNKITYQGLQYLGYCVDINQYSGSGAVTRINVLTVPHGDKIAYLWDTYASQVTTGHAAAALSSAIWEVRFETAGTLNISSGNFSISGNNTVADLAQDMLNSLPVGTYTPAHNEYILQSDGVQDMFIGSMTGDVPEPATMALLVMGGLVTVLRRRKQSR